MLATGNHARLLQGVEDKPSRGRYVLQKFGPVRPTHLDGINSFPFMIGKRVCLYVGPVLLKCQPSGFYQALDLALQGQALFDQVARGSPMVCAGCARVIPLWERRLEDPSRNHHGQLVGDERWQEVPIRHWDRGEILSLPWRKVPHRVGARAKVGIVGRVRSGWNRSLRSPSLWGHGRPWLGERGVGRAPGASRKTRVMLYILVGTVGGLRRLGPHRC